MSAGVPDLPAGGEALEQALARLGPEEAARAVAAAPSLARKSDLLWALDDRERRLALRHVPPAVVGALIQNLEDDNRYLLGDMGVEQFAALLRLCSPERQYYWLTLALSFTDARANALPLLLPTAQLAEALLTRVEFEQHLRALADYPLEDQRLPPELLTNPAQALVDLFGPENLLRVFPIADPVLAHFLQTLLDYDADRYVDLIRAALARADYEAAHPDEWTDLTETPILLDHLTPPPVVTPEARPEPEEEPPAPLAIVPVGGSALDRIAAGLPPAVRDRLAVDLQELFVRQAIAEGGSFLLSDLQRVAGSVQAYVLTGLRAESGGRPEAEAAVLAARPVHKIAQSGARVVEALRQPALRLRPHARVLDAEQRALLAALATPRLTLGPDGTVLLLLPPAGDLPDAVPLEEAGARLEGIAAWVEIARALGLDRTEAALRAAGSARCLAEELAAGAVLFGRLAPGLAEPADRDRLRREYRAAGGPDPLAALHRALAAAPLSAAAVRLLEAALARALAA